MLDLAGILAAQKAHRPAAASSTAAERAAKLTRLKEAIVRRSGELHAALHADFRKPAAEVDLSEIFTTVAEIEDTARNLAKWMRPVSVGTPLSLFGARSQIRYEPKGAVLIIGPWNYPFSLVMIPLVSALAAGNTAVIKPSELTPRTSAFIKQLLGELFEEREVAVVEGGADAAKGLLDLAFDHIFFTGSTRVGRIVMEAAAKRLTPVTLELGGKSPVILDESADMKSAARRIVWGKFLNGGQTCVAPDYVLVPEAKSGEFRREFKAALAGLYGSDEEARGLNKDLCRIISPAHYERLKAMVRAALLRGAVAETGNVFRDEERYVAPTLLSGVAPDSPAMEEEIFGPVLPLLTYRSLEEVYALVRSKDKPLALYIFSRDAARTEEILNNTRAGGTCVNNTVVHLLNPRLPFGGVGPSGAGSYHGRFGFKTFSHERSVLRQGPIDGLSLMYPPYSPKVRKIIGLAIRWLT
jgi:aldehyde dehydrogenase (NAD+)